MKLASLKGGRDGRLIVVSNDLAWFADAGHIVPTLQGALDDWERYEPLLRNLATDLDHEAIPRMRFHERDAASPLPRAYQWADGSAYVNHVALVRQARGAEMPESFWHDPLMYQGGSDAFLGPREDIPLADESWGCDLEAEVVVVTGDVPQGVSRDEALDYVRLVGQLEEGDDVAATAIQEDVHVRIVGTGRRHMILGERIGVAHSEHTAVPVHRLFRVPAAISGVVDSFQVEWMAHEPALRRGGGKFKPQR